MSSVWSIVAASTVVVVIQLLSIRYRRGLSSIPGPFSASFSNFWKVWAVYRCDMPRRNIAVHEKYGPVVRIGPNHVSFASPEALHIIHGSRQAFPKSNFYSPTSVWNRDVPVMNLLALQDVSAHVALKRKLSGLYSKAAVLTYEPQIDKCVMLFVKQIQKLSVGGAAEIDMGLWVHLFAFDSIGEINLSEKFGFLETGADVGGMIDAVNRILYRTGLYAQAPILRFMKGILSPIWGGKKENRMLTYTFAHVEKRMNNPKPASDMLNKFIELHRSEQHDLSINEVVGALYINLMAGNDVLAVTLRAIFYYLARSPHVLGRLKKEIASVNAKHPLSAPIPYAKLADLPYLDAVIHETLRIHPNIGLILERIVPPEGAFIDGYHIPGGTTVGVNAWVIHRNSDIFGKDVEIFRPERWLDCGEDKLHEMKKNLFSFGAGPRICIGRNIAMMQIAKVVVEFYRRFELVLAHPEKEWNVVGGFVTRQTGLDMRVTLLQEKEGLN